MIVWIASYPRSGNSYLQLLLWTYYKFLPYSLYLAREMPRLDDALVKETKERFGDCIFEPVHVPLMAQSTESHCIKTHELPQNDFPAIYLVRDGRDALVSYARFIQHFEQPRNNFEVILRNLIIDPGFFGGWRNHVLAWTQRHVPTVLLKFEELLQTPDPLAILKQTLRQMNIHSSLDADAESVPTFAELHQKAPHLFRQGQIGGWKEEMSPELHKLFWHHHGDAMCKMGYTQCW